MKKRAISFITLMMFVITNIISTVPVVSADEQESILYEYDDYTVEYSILETWEDTKKVSVSINNTGEEVIENWMIYFEPNGEIYDIWDAEKAITTQPIAYIRNSKYNANIQPNENSKFSYLIKNNENAPESFSLCQNRKDIEEGFQVDLKELNCWEDTKFQGEIYLTNITSDPLESWELTVDTNFTIEKITNSWAAEVTELSEGRYLLKGNYNSIVQPYSSVVLGFLGVKNGTPEISDYSLSVVSVDEPFLSSIITKQFEDEPIPELSMYARANIQDNEIEISWIPNKEISGVEYKIFEIADEHSSLCVGSTNDLSFGYTLENNFINKRLYVEAYYNDLFVGKSNEFIVQNNDGIFCSELIDTDGDNISDYIENTIGTDATKADTDDDGLNDYQEFFVLETDPLKKDSDDNGILDGDEDCDSDGLTNLSELEKSTNPVMSDSDNDKLSDYDELFTYNTNPLLEDTDMDGVNDYDEIMLGINPNNSSDSDKIVDQIIDVDDECLNGVNVEGLPYNISMNIKASGYVAGSLKAENSLSYSSTYSFDTIGEIPEFSYNNGNVEDVTINFEFDEKFIDENKIDFDSLNVFKYYDEVNMFIPQKTIRNENEKILSCESESLGTFCVKDINDWMANFVDHKDGSEDNLDFLSSGINTMAKSAGNDTTLLRSSDTKTEPINVVFALDQTYFTGERSRINNIKDNIINVSEKLYKVYDNLNIVTMIYSHEGVYYDYHSDIDSVKRILSNVDNLYTNDLPYVEAPMYVLSQVCDVSKTTYLFNYNGFMFIMTDPNIQMTTDKRLADSSDIHVCFAYPYAISSPGVSDYIQYYSEKYDGKIFNLKDKNIDNQIFDYISKEPKLKKKSSYISPGTDAPSVDEPVNTKPSNRYVLSSNLTTVTLDAPLTKNSTIDTDKDGLTDVEELIQSSELVKWDDDGNIILPTLNDVIRYCGLYGNKYSLPDDIMDYDLYHDFLRCKVLPVRSNPKYSDYDEDGYNDFDELKNHETNPLKYNELISFSDVEYITDNNRFAASACRDYNDESVVAEISVFIANNIMGSNHDYVTIYKEHIVEYLKTISDDKEKNPYDKSTLLYYINIGTQIEALLDRIVVASTQMDNPAVTKRIQDVIDAFAEERVLLIRDFRNNKITMEQFVARNDELFEYAWNNEILVKYFGNSKYRNKVFKSTLNIGDKINCCVTYGSIIAGGAVQVTKSMFDLAKIIEHEGVIRNNTDILNNIIFTTKSDCMRNAARDLLYDIQNQSTLFYNELCYLVVDTELVVTDGLVRVKIASCCSVGTVVIAGIALWDWHFGTSDIGLLTLKCYTFASISDSLSKKIEEKSRYLDKSGKQYEHTFIGDYVLYNDITEYKTLISNLCVSRIKGEENALDMNDHHSVRVFLKFLMIDADNYYDSVSNTITAVSDIKNKI